MTDDMRVCGFARHEMELLSAGDGDRKLGRLRLALAAFEKCVAAEGADAQRGEAMCDIAEAYDTMNDVPAATGWLDRALALDAFRTSDAWAWRSHSAALRYLWRGDHLRAVALAGDALSFARRKGAEASEGGVIGVLVTLADALVGAGQPADALPLVSEGRALFARSAWLQKHSPGYLIELPYHEGRALAALGQLDAAARVLDEAEAATATWKENPERRNILLASAGVRRDLGQHEEALSRVREVDAWWDEHIALRQKHDAEPAELDAARAERDALRRAWGLQG